MNQTKMVSSWMRLCLASVLLLVLLSVAEGAALLIQADDDLSEEHWEAEVQCLTHDPPTNACLPQVCKRTVKDDIFSEEEIMQLRAIATKGYATRGEGEGGPTILDINTGYIRDPAGLENLFSREGAETIFHPEDFALYGKVIAKLRSEVVSVTGAKVGRVHVCGGVRVGLCCVHSPSVD